MMPSLNYLGSSTGAGTMPSAVPGMGAIGTPGPGPLPSGPVPPGAPMGGAPLAGLMPPQSGPTPDQYQAVTQSDGSILLHIKLPNGDLGPAVKIITPPKPKQSAPPNG